MAKAKTTGQEGKSAKQIAEETGQDLIQAAGEREAVNMDPNGPAPEGVTKQDTGTTEGNHVANLQGQAGKPDSSVEENQGSSDQLEEDGSQAGETEEEDLPQGDYDPENKEIEAPAPPDPTADENAGYPVFPKDDPFKAKKTHVARVTKYGKNYVVASKGQFQNVWTKQSWDKMDGSKNGWTEATPVPEEVVANYKSKKQQ